jgi:hypothetical protein
MKKLEKKIDAILDSLKDDQSLFAMCNNDEGGFFYSYNSRSSEIGAGVATILDDWYNDGKQESRRAAEGIIQGVVVAIMSNEKASREIMRVLAPSAAKAALRGLKEIRKRIEEVGEDEDCENCEHNRECNLPSAIRYRKENGIPAPRKRGARKNKKDPKGN